MERKNRIKIVSKKRFITNIFVILILAMTSSLINSLSDKVHC